MTQAPWPLMQNNVHGEDLDALIAFLHGEKWLTNGDQVRAFEAEWSAWLGVTHSVLVTSGSSANLLTLAALRELVGPGDVIVPPLTWASDIVAVLQHGFTPVFADINPRTLGMSTERILEKITPKTRAVFLTHALGFNALTTRLIDECEARGITLLEDACESVGATYGGRKVGTFGLISNFSFYYAHHLTTVEGGMVCTNDDEVADLLRCLRGHGLVRERRWVPIRVYEEHADLSPDFIFAVPGYNARPTELQAVLGRSQLKRLDAANRERRERLGLWLHALNAQRYETDFETAGSCNYALPLLLKENDPKLRDRVMDVLHERHVECRRGMSGGGNQLRQPYLRRLGLDDPLYYPETERIHWYGFYLGNYPALDPEQIIGLAKALP